MWPSIVIGVVVGVLAVPIVLESSQALRAWYDRANPPATADLIEATQVDSSLRFRLRVARHRDCEIVRLAGYSGSGDLAPAEVLRREDGSQPESYPAGNVVISRPWVLMPWLGPRLVLYGYYDCSGVIVRTKLIDQEVALQ